MKIEGYIISNDDKPFYCWFGIGATCPNDVEKAIKEANGKPLDVEISTCYGGLISQGSEIYTALRGYSGGVNIKITGLAASAASIIAMGGHSSMSPTAMMMVHNVQSIAEGDYHSMDNESDVLKECNKALSMAYQGKSGMSEKDALKMMDKTTWLSAKDAVDLHLVDEVMFSQTPDLVNSFNGALPLTKEMRAAAQKALLKKEKADNADENGKKPKSESEEGPGTNNNEVKLAKAKLNLYEKTLNLF